MGQLLISQEVRRRPGLREDGHLRGPRRQRQGEGDPVGRLDPAALCIGAQGPQLPDEPRVRHRPAAGPHHADHVQLHHGACVRRRQVGHGQQRRLSPVPERGQHRRPRGGSESPLHGELQADHRRREVRPHAVAGRNGLHGTRRAYRALPVQGHVPHQPRHPPPGDAVPQCLGNH